MDTDERLRVLENRLAEHDALINKILAIAAGHPKGRFFLKLLGVELVKLP